MTNVMHGLRENFRAQIAANVRAELARAQIRPAHLPKLLGKSQPYWHRRVNGQLPFDTDDLAGLATLLGVDPQRFLEVDFDRSAGSIYFHGNTSSHTGGNNSPSGSPDWRASRLGIAS